MREMDTESPVIWPAWCYTGDTTGETETPNQPQLKTRRRRLPDRMNGTSVTDYHITNNNNNNTSNNNVKNERLSPGTPDTSSRSRSVTPSSASYPGTPPASEHSQPLPLSGRNYSDFMRSLAAKYNNANPNDYFGAARNGFPPALDSRFKANPTFSNLIPNNKDDPPKKPSEFPNLLNPFVQNPMFPPLIDMSTTQTLLAMVRTAKEVEIQGLLKSASGSSVKRPANDVSSPLDLSAAGTPMKRARVKTPSSSGKNSDSESPRPVHHQENVISSWSVDDVCNFVSSIDICAEYAQKFREQRIDGSGLPLLTEEHLTTTINMKLGPALKLRSILARKMGSCSVCLHCVHCHSSGSESGGTGAGTSGDSGGPS